jgi:hypothetical protein
MFTAARNIEGSLYLLSALKARRERPRHSDNSDKSGLTPGVL